MNNIDNDVFSFGNTNTEVINENSESTNNSNEIYENMNIQPNNDEQDFNTITNTIVENDLQYFRSPLNNNIVNEVGTDIFSVDQVSSEILNQNLFEQSTSSENDVDSIQPSFSEEQYTTENQEDLPFESKITTGFEIPEDAIVNEETISEEPQIETLNTFEMDSKQFEEENNLEDTFEVDENQEESQMEIPNPFDQSFGVEEQFEESIPVSFETETINPEETIVEDVKVEEGKTLEQPSKIEEEQDELISTPVETETINEPENTIVPVEEDVISEQVNLIPEEPVETTERTGVITMSNTSAEELNKLTEYKEPERVDSTDIKSLFDRVGINVKEASDIFKKNTEMKEKLDSRFEELKKLQSEVQKAKKIQHDEIDSYKKAVLEKLNDKKEEIEKRLNKLKEYQSTLEKEKERFEAYKKAEKAEIEKVQKEVQEAYDVRREELNHIEDVLRKQKDALDEERNQLSLDRIQYEADKNELANNLLKFNEIVDSFTNGMDKIGKE